MLDQWATKVLPNWTKVSGNSRHKLWVIMSHKISFQCSIGQKDQNQELYFLLMKLMLSFVLEKKKWQQNFDQQSTHSLPELVNPAKNRSHASSLKPPFPCPVEVLKYYFYRQDNKLRKSTRWPSTLTSNEILGENEAAFNNVGFFVQPKSLDRLVVDDVWYLTTYFKPKSTLSNVFIRLRQTGQNMSVYPLKVNHCS